MAKFVKRSERKKAEQAISEETSPESKEAIEPRKIELNKEEEPILSDSEFIKSLIGDFSSVKKDRPISELPIESSTQEGIEAENLPETESDIVYKSEPSFYKGRSGEGLPRKKPPIFIDANTFEPVPESNPEVKHYIKKVRHESSVPGEEPIEGKFAETPNEENAPVKNAAEENGKMGRTKKYIHAVNKKKETRREEPSEGEAETIEPVGKKKKHSLSGLPLPEDPAINRFPEYTRAEYADKIKNFLKKTAANAKIKLLISGISTLILVIFAILPMLLQPKEAETLILPIFGGNGLAYGIVNLIFFLIAIIPLVPDFFGGVLCLFRKRADGETALLLSWIAVLIQNIVLLFYPEKIFVQIPLYQAPVCVITLLMYLAKILDLLRTADGFRLLSSAKESSILHTVDDARRGERIGQGILEPNAKISYRAKTDFVNRIINSSYASEPTTGICTRLLPLSLIAAVLSAVIKGILTRDLAVAATFFAAILLVTMPISVSVSLKWLLHSFNGRLNPEGGAIPSYAAAVDFSSSDAVIFDAVDLYEAGTIDLSGAKTFHNFNLLECILYASAVYTAVDCPLNSVFSGVLCGHFEDLPPVDSILYEEKQGLSAWIHDEKILLGTREMMLNHNVDVPDIELEHAYLRKNPDNKIVYLSVKEELAAFFVVTYSLKPETAEELSYLARHGYTVLLRSNDPNINETLIERQLSLPADTVKILNNEAAEYYKLCRREKVKTKKTPPFSVGNITSVLRVMTASVKLKNALDLSAPLAFVGAILAFLITVLMGFFSSVACLPGYIIFLMQVLLTVVSFTACVVSEKRG